MHGVRERIQDLKLHITLTFRSKPWESGLKLETETELMAKAGYDDLNGHLRYGEYICCLEAETRLASVWALSSRKPSGQRPRRVGLEGPPSEPPGLKLSR